MISIICVLGKNRAIGYKNKLIWNIPEDLKHFRKITSGHVIIMGRKTYESIGKPLLNRINIIITRDKKYFQKQCYVCDSLEKALKLAKEKSKNEIFIIGGGEIYRVAFQYVDKLYLTLVDDEPKNADTFFPDYNEFKKVIIKKESELNGLKFKFVELER
ncbi:dihydrofolate reductase [Candidatus Kuenenbacteria bacterium]|nr:dihydrofolate reductase [Candidatus Kuenenbacteria bacterium]